MVVRLVKTNIVTLRANGDVVISSGGWRTHSTIQCINTALNILAPGLVVSRTWLVTDGVDLSVHFKDGMTVPCAGRSGQMSIKLTLEPMEAEEATQDEPAVVATVEVAGTVEVDATEERLRAELNAMKLSALVRRATDEGVDLEDADDDKAMIVALLLTASASRTQPTGDAEVVGRKSTLDEALTVELERLDSDDSDEPATAAAEGNTAAAKLEDVDDGDVDELGLEAKDIALVAAQAGVSRAKAVQSLRENDGDIVSAIVIPLHFS